MELKSSDRNGYVSCIKIAGIPILPPLITEQRRKELNDDKAKAIALEKKLIGKRSSIDSGVMTGSYTDSFKNSDSKQINDFTTHEFPTSDLTSNGADNFHDTHVESQFSQANGDTNDSFLKSALEDPDFKEFFQSTAERLFKNSNDDVKVPSSKSESISSDSFLRTALEDSEFRDFFYTTADKIFKDNNIINSERNLSNNKTDSVVCNGVVVRETLEVPSYMSQYLNSNECLEFGVCHDPNLPLSSTEAESDPILKYSENNNNHLQKVQSEEPQPSPQMVRRNSFTLDSPSPALLEHMTKENAKNKNERKKWTSLTDKKEKDKGPEFKPFLSDKKPRKMWDKKCTDHSLILKDNILTSKRFNVPLIRAKTFVKSKMKCKKTINSLPSSCRTSPIHLNKFAHSTGCIKSITEISPSFDRSNTELNDSLLTKPIKKVKSPTQSHLSTSSNSESINKPGNSVDLSTVSSNKEITHESSEFTFDNDNSFLQSVEPSDSASQISAVTQSTSLQTSNECMGNINPQSIKEQGGDLDDSLSICSSLSLSKFLPSCEGLSRPSTAEEFSSLFSKLQLQHERQITELLEKQHKEKILLTKLHSNSGTLSSRCTSHLSVFDPANEVTCSQTTSSEEKRSTCSRELFPSADLIPSNKVQSNDKDNKLEEKKAAATKITACVRGYLTRRLLKTEKVQQLLDVIRESLNCAFSLQCETHLRRNDFELHERLAHQLNASFHELQSIIFGPVTQKMSIIAADRERLRKPLSRPSSAISTATRRSLLRKQQSMINAETSKLPQENRLRTKSLCLAAKPNLVKSRSFVRSDSSSPAISSSGSRKPWR